MDTFPVSLLERAAAQHARLEPSPASARVNGSRPALLGRERRAEPRREVRACEGFDAAVILERGSAAVPVRLYDLSNQGAGIVVSEALAQRCRSRTRLSLELRLPDGQRLDTEYELQAINWHQGGYRRLGLQAVNRAAPDEGTWDDMLEIPSDRPLIAYVRKAEAYSEHAALFVRSISRNHLELELADGDMLVCPGLELELAFSPESVHEEALTAVVDRVLSGDSERPTVLASITALPRKAERRLVDHLIRLCGSSPARIRSAKLAVRHIARHCTFRCVKTHEEYMEVLELRFKAYKAAGKLKETQTVMDMRAPLDPISRILTVYHGRTLIGSVALAFPEYESVPLDTERALAGGYPSHVPEKRRMIEVSRLCTEPAYRGTDLLVRIFQHVYRVAMTSDREFFISSTDDKLWPLYKRLGFVKLGVSYDHPYLAGIPHHLMLLRRRTLSEASGIGPANWNHLFRDMTEYIDKTQEVRRPWLARVKLFAYRAIADTLGSGSAVV
jgi:Acetyltransferase (GNAT) domain